jgi:hypothetical protein
MRNVLRLQQRFIHLYKHKYISHQIYYHKPLSLTLPLQLRYSSNMAEKEQNSKGLAEKVKNIALGGTINEQGADN